jgi:hypothetical protein
VFFVVWLVPLTGVFAAGAGFFAAAAVLDATGAWPMQVSNIPVSANTATSLTPTLMQKMGLSAISTVMPLRAP